jgi:vanillate O-demethylase ferredoxin subunit
VLGSARAQGWPESQLHYEFFGAEVAKSDSDASFEIKLASSGRIIVVPKDKTITKALAEAGVDIMMSCEQGVCGTCLTRVIEGTPDEQAANDQFLPCCSRSKTPMLVLDL